MTEKIIEINNTKIPDRSHAYIVAEIGLNHNGNIDLAKNMIKRAKECGADAVKFQTYNTENLILEDSQAYNLFKRLELSKEQFRELCNFSNDVDITFFSTPFCIGSVDILEELNVPCYKIASMDTDHYDLIKYIAGTGKPVILSTGMSKIGLIERAVNTIEKTGNDKIIILHTISKYPPENKDMRLRMIEKLGKIFANYPIGFSDHSMDNTMAIAARVMGAALFEKHFTLDRKMEGPDHAISMTPDDITDLRNKLTAIDEGINEINEERADMVIEKGARRGLYAKRALNKGEIIENEMIAIVRPRGTFKPEDISLFIGKSLTRDMKKNEMFDLSCIM